MTYTVDDVVAFAKARHRAYLGKDSGDPIIAAKKFTNVFRVLDRGSQYLLSLMNQLETTEDRLAMSYLYRQVNRPDTMDVIIDANDGFIPSFAEVTSAKWIRKVIWPTIEALPGRFLNGAYIILIMTNDKRDLAHKMEDIFPGARPHLAAVAGAASLADRVRLLQQTPGLGPFLSMQIATDMGYCEGEPDQENTFILPGPGSRKGVSFISDQKAEQVIKHFPVERLPWLPGSNGRRASWMDIQNVFCEFSKYARYKNSGKALVGEYQRHGKYPVKIPSQFIR